MQDLTGKQGTGSMAVLVPSSMQAGNTTADRPSLAMTAPGSQSSLPVADKTDILPMPEWTDHARIPVSFPGAHDRVTLESADQGNATWTDMHDVPAASRWKETT